MNNSDNIYYLICSLYDEFKANPNIDVLCTIETDKNNYFGNFFFDENFVISKDSLILTNSHISKNYFEEASLYNKTCISFDAIKTFSYKILNKKMDN